jgi:Phosphotransferase enzyme family
MLAAAREALMQHGVLSPDQELPPFFAKLGGNLVLGMLVYLKNGSFYVVKVAMQSRLDREYRGLSMAHAAMPCNVPQPIGLTSHRSFPVLVSSGVRHKPLASFRGSMEMLEGGINDFFANSARAFVALRCGETVDLQQALEHTSKLVPWPDWQAYWHHIASDVAVLPRIYQHGDLTVNNIGVAGRELIFFDWEDFAYIDLPGFDLAVLLLSLNDFDVRRLTDRLRASCLERRLMQSGCTCLGISTNLFLTLFPAYLSLFARMKGMLGYAPEVPGRAIAALAQWLISEHSHTCTL